MTKSEEVFSPEDIGSLIKSMQGVLKNPKLLELYPIPMQLTINESMTELSGKIKSGEYATMFAETFLAKKHLLSPQKYERWFKQCSDSVESLIHPIAYAANYKMLESSTEEAAIKALDTAMHPNEYREFYEHIKSDIGITASPEEYLEMHLAMKNHQSDIYERSKVLLLECLSEIDKIMKTEFFAEYTPDCGSIKIRGEDPEETTETVNQS